MDIRLFFEKSGQGAPLILLHGNGEDHTYFTGQIPRLSSRFTVYAVDSRGHGQSPMGEKPFTLSQFADDLKDFLDEQGIRQAHVLGFSDGANIAMLFALRYPERLLSLVLNSGNLDPSGLVPSLLEEIETRYEAIRTSEEEKDRYEAGLLRLMLFEPQIRPEELSAISVPTLVIAGDRDLIPAAHTERIAERIPDSRLVFFSGSHGVAEENPKAFNDAVCAFYDAIGA